MRQRKEKEMFPNETQNKRRHLKKVQSIRWTGRWAVLLRANSPWHLLTSCISISVLVLDHLSEDICIATNHLEIYRYSLSL